MIRPRMLFATRFRYWRAGDGEATRTRALVEALAGVCELIVFFPEPSGSDACVRRGRRQPAPLSAGAGRQRTPRTGCPARRHDPAVRPGETRLGTAVAAATRLPSTGGTAELRLVMDTHDLVSDNAVSRQRLGIEAPEVLDFERELGYLCHYDRVLLIQPDDHSRAAAVLGERAVRAASCRAAGAAGAARFARDRRRHQSFRCESAWLALVSRRRVAAARRCAGQFRGRRACGVHASAGDHARSRRHGRCVFLMADDPDDFAPAWRHPLDDDASRAALAARALDLLAGASHPRPVLAIRWIGCGHR